MALACRVRSAIQKLCSRRHTYHLRTRRSASGTRAECTQSELPFAEAFVLPYCTILK